MAWCSPQPPSIFGPHTAPNSSTVISRTSPSRSTPAPWITPPIGPYRDRTSSAIRVTLSPSLTSHRTTTTSEVVTSHSSIHCCHALADTPPLRDSSTIVSTPTRAIWCATTSPSPPSPPEITHTLPEQQSSSHPLIALLLLESWPRSSSISASRIRRPYTASWRIASSGSPPCLATRSSTVSNRSAPTVVVGSIA